MLRAVQACVPRTGPSQGGRSEPHLNSTVQRELVLLVPGIVPGSVAEGTGENARIPARREGRSYYSRSLRTARSGKAGSRFRGRSSLFMKYPD